MQPRPEYSRRLEQRRRTYASHQRSHQRMGQARLGIVAIAALIAWFAFHDDVLSGWWLLAPLVLFLAAMSYHQRIMRRMECAGRAVTFYERALERLDGNWAGHGDAGDRFRNPKHPYVDDLDLFVTGGLFELLSSARTRAGENTLAAWLMRPAAIDTLRARHQAIEELRDKIDLREDLFVLGGDVAAGVNPEALVEWAGRPLVAVSPAQRTMLALLGSLGLVLLGFLIGSEFMGLWQRIAMMSVVLVNLGVMFAYRKIVAEVTGALEHPAEDLALFSSVLERIERERFDSPLLGRLRGELNTDGDPASHRIARLNRLVELIDSRDNFFVRLLEPVVLWTPQLVFQAEAWRARSGVFVPRWVAATGDIEALASLAGYAFEHPADPFPEFDDASPVFDAEALAHPLLVNGVSNDVRLDASKPLLLVSGSNMSGKSTLLRAVGVNTVLALAGAPVRASRLRIALLNTGASIRVTDSLQEGSSQFYAEITRIRNILDLPRPALFLLDELLHGTNSHDRLIGSEGILRALLHRGAIGLVTTHDLALAAIPGARNVHFEDRIEDGKMIFDYHLREGVVEHSNALDLMRAVGLDV
jgi:predicted ATPase